MWDFGCLKSGNGVRPLTGHPYYNFWIFFCDIVCGVSTPAALKHWLNILHPKSKPNFPMRRVAILQKYCHNWSNPAPHVAQMRSRFTVLMWRVQTKRGCFVLKRGILICNWYSLPQNISPCTKKYPAKGIAKIDLATGADPFTVETTARKNARQLGVYCRKKYKQVACSICDGVSEEWVP